MTVFEGCILTFLQTIKDINGNKLLCFKRKLVYKSGAMHKKVYAALKGKTQGETIQIEVSKAEIPAYNPEKLITLPKDVLPPGLQPKKGMLLKALHNQQAQFAHIHRVDSDTVTLDLNPYQSLIGKDVIYEVTVLEIEELNTKAMSLPREQRDLLLDDKSYCILP